MRAGMAAVGVGLVLGAIAPLQVMVPFLVLLLRATFWPSGIVLRLSRWCVLGFVWSAASCLWQYGQGWPSVCEGVDLRVIGTVTGLPVIKQQPLPMTRFELIPERMVVGPEVCRSADLSSQRWRVSWYGHVDEVRPGQRFELTVNLRKPRGLVNEAGFDNELWMLSAGLTASAYVKDKPAPPIALGGQDVGIEGLRWWLKTQLQPVLAATDHRAVFLALTLGIKDEFTDEDWDLLTATGTVHLVVISGMHVAFFAIAAYFIAYHTLCLSGGVSRLPVHSVAAILAILVAILYAGLAGFSVPTVRSLVMVFLLFAARALGMRWPWWSGFVFSLVLILWVSPLSAVTTGLWLSFGAVALLLVAFVGRSGGARAWLGSTVIVGIGLAPLTLLLVGKVAPASPLFNLIAVPLFSFILIPGSLIGLLLSLIDQELATSLFGALDCILRYVWTTGEQVQDWIRPLQPNPPAYSPASAIMAFIACLIAVVPRGFPGRWLALGGLLPLLIPPLSTLPDGHFQATFIDVGQGSAVLISTRNHHLVFDAGPITYGGFDLGEAVVVPLLRKRGVDELDVLVISHNDLDHAGGYKAIEESLKVRSVYGGQHWLGAPDGWTQCTDQQWWWDGVKLRFFSGGIQAASLSDNNRSCVLQIEGLEGSLLLTGDIEARRELQLLADYGSALQSSVLMAPHHGSNSSSSASFIATVDPQVVVFSAGYRNRFGHPHDKVIGRFRDQGAQAKITAETGQIDWRTDSNPPWRSFRGEGTRPWYLQWAERTRPIGGSEGVRRM